MKSRKDGTLSMEFTCDAIIKPFFSLELNSRENVGRRDTGADLTTIPRSVAEQLDLYVMPNSELALSGFGNHWIESDGIASVNVAYGGKKQVILVAVAGDAKTKPIWGLNIFYEFSIVRIAPFKPDLKAQQLSTEVLRCCAAQTEMPIHASSPWVLHEHCHSYEKRCCP